MADSIIARTSQSGYDTEPALGRAQPAHGTGTASVTVVDSRNGFVTDSGESVAWDVNDPASVEAWFGNFGHAEHFRKVVLASCREAERAKALESGTKVTEARLDDLARISDKYVQYLIDTLHGRHLREQNVLSSMNR